MAKRWSINEDIIICLNCIKYPGAYSKRGYVEHLAHLLQEAGYESRSIRSIQHRAYAFEIVRYSAELAERPALVVANKMDAEAAQENLAAFIRETGVEPLAISCATREGLDAFKEALRKVVNPKLKFHHTHADHGMDLSEMPDTTGDEIPAEALKFATFLKLEKPKAKSHPSRGNIH